jgi:hypothetical protein
MRTAPPWRDTVGAIACPILLVTGDPGRGGLVTAAVAEEARRTGGVNRPADELRPA